MKYTLMHQLYIIILNILQMILTVISNDLFFGLETILRYHHIITTEVEYYTHTYIILVAAG